MTTRKNAYGEMPTAPEYQAKVKGDGGIYKVWGLDWLNHRVLIYRAMEYQWYPIDKIRLVLISKEES